MPLTHKQLLVILGPTAVGKTDLAIELAKKFNGELISCDSRQVYVGLDIGTGKFPSGNWKMEDGRWKKGQRFWEIDGVKVWMYDVVSPNKQYTVYNFVKDAQKAIKQISKNNKLPIIVGGTGLYLRALIDGLSNLGIPVNLTFRKQLGKLTVSQLQEKLKKTPILWNKLNKSDRGNSRRLVRAIELGLKGNRDDQGNLGLAKKFNMLKIGLTASKDILYAKSDKRVITRVNQGMIDEAKRLYKKGLSRERMKQLGLEYGVLADYLEGQIKDEEELIKILQGKIHGYVRRQLTWFKKEKDVNWFDITKKNYVSKVENLMAKWYHPYDAA